MPRHVLDLDQISIAAIVGNLLHHIDDEIPIGGPLARRGPAAIVLPAVSEAIANVDAQLGVGADREGSPGGRFEGAKDGLRVLDERGEG